MRKFCIAYHMPYPSTIYATKYIYEGFKHAFEDMGHTFVTLTPDDQLEPFLKKHQPDIFITASHFFYRKFLDFEVLKKYRQKGMVLLTKIDYWQSPIHSNRINEAPSMKDDQVAKSLIRSGLLGDHYFCTASQDDGRMRGFSDFAGQPYITIPLAADKYTLVPKYDEGFAADISFIGTNLPQKRDFFKEWLFPLEKKYDVKLYGQDWTKADRALGLIMKTGQYFNVPVLKDLQHFSIPLVNKLQKPKIKAGDEAKIYASSSILVNLHEDYQRTFGGDCNERTFKIPFCGGFEICDNVAVVRQYFTEDKEIVIARDKNDWFDKIEYYAKHPDEAKKIASAGKKRARAEHTYHNRAQQIVELL